MKSTMRLDSSTVIQALQEWFEARWHGEPMKVVSVKVGDTGDGLEVALSGCDAETVRVAPR